MKFLQQFRSSLAVVVFASILAAASLSACDSKGKADDDKESTEHPAADSAEHADHPKGESEHPTNDADSTEVVN
jgi:hypothetical protein